MKEHYNFLIISHVLAYSGVSRVSIELSHTLAEKGNYAHIATVHEINTDGHIIPNTIRLIPLNLHMLRLERLRVLPLLRYIYPLLKAWHFKRVLSVIDKKYGPFDLVLSVEMLPSIIFPRRIRANMYYWLHRDSRDPINNTRRMFSKIVMQNQRVIAVSKGVLDGIISKNDGLGAKLKESHVIYNPLDINKIKKLSNEPNSNIPNEPYIIHAGRFSPEKRHDRLLKAFKLIKTPCKLVLLTAHSDKLNNLIKHHDLGHKVIVAGFQNNPYQWFKHAKLAILCSDHEALPMVILESLTCNCPVVSTDCKSGPNEILTGDLSQWLVPMDNPETLIARLANKIDKALATRIVINSEMLKKFDANNIASQYMAIAAAGTHNAP